MENDQAQAVEGDLLEQMSALLEAEEANQEAVEEPEESQEVEAESDEATEEAEEETAEEEVLEITWNGENKALKRSEVVELAQKGYDYTTKTQQLAEQRKNLEAQQAFLKQQAFIQSNLADKMAEIKSLDSQIAQYKQINWQELAQNDPMQYLTFNQSFQQLKDSRNELVQEFQGKAQELTQAQFQQYQAALSKEAQLLRDAIPELKGDKSQQTQAELRSYLASRGFSDDEIGTIADHRILKMAYEAAKFAKLQSAKPEVRKKMAEAPKTIKSKQANVPNQQLQELRSKAKKGDERAIAALIERTL